MKIEGATWAEPHSRRNIHYESRSLGAAIEARIKFIIAVAVLVSVQ
jgi:hypothetical protein